MPIPVRSTGPGPAMRFRPPARQAGSLTRERVTHAIDVATKVSALAVVSAPSGYGKTIAVADWVATSPGVTAWLSLGKYDSDPRRLAQGVVRALLSAVAPFGTSGVELQLDPDVEDVADAYQAICQALSATDRKIMLVIDDAQRAGEAWQDGLLGALVDQPPEGLRLVLVGTTLIEVSLSRLALSNPRAFVGAAQLVFDEEEIALLHGGTASTLTPELILSETRGWPIAVRLMMLAGTVPESSPTRDAGLLRSYVRDHVLSALPEPLAQFVLDSTVCGDMTVGLARAVTSRPDASQLLDECVRLGLFLDRFEVGNETLYRWHSVFARQCIKIAHETDPARLAHGHRRAAQFLEEHDPLAAVAHASLAGDFDEAQAILLRRWVGLIAGSSAAAVEVVCIELTSALGENPALLLVRACALDVTGQHRVARELFARADTAILESDVSNSVQSMLQLARLFMVDDRAGSAEASARVRTMLMEGDATILADRAAINYLLGWTEIRHRTDSQLPVEYFTAAASEAQVRDDHALARRARGHLAFAYTWAGQFRNARKILTELDVESEDISPWGYYAGGSAAAASGYVAYWAGDLDAATADFGRVIAAGSSNISFAGVARMMLAYAASETGDLFACRRAAVGIQDIPRREAHGVSWPAFRESSVAMLEEAAGQPQRAVQIARKYLDCGDLPVVCVALAGILRRSGDSAAALQMLRSLRGFADLSYVKVATLNTAAVLKREAGDHEAAHAFCETALEVATAENIRLPYGEREGQVRRLLRDHVSHGTRFEDFIASCLADGAPRAALQSLTEREMSVYRQFQTSRTLAEIAAELGLSVNTVKTHQRSIYRKLEVTTRRGAVQAGI